MKRHKLKNILSDNRGQGLIEYLIIVGLMAVASIGVMTVLGQNVQAQFGKIASALSGKKSDNTRLYKVRKDHTKLKDLGNFIDGATNENRDK